jgi:hypothetical protein
VAFALANVIAAANVAAAIARMIWNLSIDSVPVATVTACRRECSKPVTRLQRTKSEKDAWGGMQAFM